MIALPSQRQFPLASMPTVAIPALFKPTASPLHALREENEALRLELDKLKLQAKREAAKAAEALRLANVALGYHRERMASQVLAGVIDNTGGKPEPIRERQVIVVANRVTIWDSWRFPVLRKWWK